MAKLDAWEVLEAVARFERASSVQKVEMGINAILEKEAAIERLLNEILCCPTNPLFVPASPLREHLQRVYDAAVETRDRGRQVRNALTDRLANN